jgi:hypothetical protein
MAMSNLGKGFVGHLRTTIKTRLATFSVGSSTLNLIEIRSVVWAM